MSQRAAHVEDSLLDFAYGELPPAEAAAVQRHLDGCADCRGQLEDIQGVRRVMSAAPQASAPQAGLDSLLAYAEQAARRAQAGPPPKPSGWRRYMAPLTGLCAVAVVGVVAHRVNERVGTVEALRDKVVLAKAAPEAPAEGQGVAEPETQPVLPRGVVAPPPAAEAKVREAEASERSTVTERVVMPRDARAEAPARRTRSVATATNAMPAPLAAPSKDVALEHAKKRAESDALEDAAAQRTARAAEAPPMPQPAPLDDFGGGGGKLDSSIGVGSMGVPVSNSPPARSGGAASRGPAAKSMPSPSARATREVELAYSEPARDDSAAERTPLARKGKAEKAAREAEQKDRSAQARALLESAIQAYADDDRELEARLLRRAVSLAGPDRPLLSGLLVRLCSAEYALGRTPEGDAACARVTEEFRGTAAARVAERQRAEHHAALGGGAAEQARPAAAPASTGRGH